MEVLELLNMLTPSVLAEVFFNYLYLPRTKSETNLCITCHRKHLLYLLTDCRSDSLSESTLSKQD